MNEQKIRTEFKKLFIGSIHGLPYKEAIEKESGLYYNVDNIFEKAHWSTVEYLGKNEELGYIFPITIGRVMQALSKVEGEIFCLGSDGYIVRNLVTRPVAKWKLTKENCQECVDDDQAIETIESLTKLFK